MKVLVVEGSRFFQQFIGNIFSNEGLVVSVANDIDNAKDILHRERFNFVCTALQLPHNHNGIELCRYIRKQTKYKDIPVILLTSDDIDNTFSIAYDAGVTEIYSRSNIKDLSLHLSSSVERQRNTLSGYVLYIEDSKTAAHLITKQLEKLQLDVDHFFNAEEAFEHYFASSQEYDLVITDIVLEGSMNGIGLVREIRSLQGKKGKIPILAISGHDDTARRIQLLSLGANDYIVKPVIEEELVVRVSNLITTKQLFDQVTLQQQRLYDMAMTDQLTDLYNRHSLVEFSNKYISDAYRHEKALSLLMIDLDHFKSINDSYGHAKGDIVLSSVGKLLKTSFRGEDFVARFGGEEFVVLMAGCSLEKAFLKGETIRKLIELLRPEGLDITASIGISSLPKKRRIVFDELFKYADEAVYQAKEEGRNCVIMSPVPERDKINL